MKYNTTISSKPGKSRLLHFNASSNERRVLMSAPLSKELRAKYNVRSLPIRKNDEVFVRAGKNQNNEGKVTAVYRKKWCIHVERIAREGKKGDSKPVGIKPSNCVITKLHLDKDREALLARKKRDTTRVTDCQGKTAMTD